MMALVAMMLMLAPGDIPRPEHPRPDLQREHWLNLNGTWEFAETDDREDRSFLTTREFPDHILVPFARESALSGLGRTGFVTNVWYRRTFEVPQGWEGKRVRLHVGASDWETTLWVNGEQIGTYVGGNSAFDFEITRALRPGQNTVVIHAFDDTRSGLQPLGKQAITPKSESIFYTRTTGIWQTVWLEAVGEAFVKHLHVVPDVPGKRFTVRAEVDGARPGMKVRATLSAEGKQVAQSEAVADWRNGFMLLDVPSPRLWSPEDPFLYDLKVEILEGEKAVDALSSYAGLRNMSIRGRELLLNDKPVFQRLVLDQGFYPDGIWTAPSDAALRADIELSMAAGFNGARLHQKVFEPRFLYWAAKLGYLVWGEYPSYGANYGDARVQRPILEEWANIVRRDRNQPAIIGWCPFNETPSEAIPLQNSSVRITWQLDPTRPVIETSGWTHGLPEAEIRDAHDYDQNPASFRARWHAGVSGEQLPLRYRHLGAIRPFMVSEYGGIGWDTGDGWGYGNAPKTLDEFYTRLHGLTQALLDHPGMFGFCYTQLTDVEQERNGIYTYDRKPKFDMARVKSIFGGPAAFERGETMVETGAWDWQVLVGSSRDSKRKPWEFTFTAPSEGWATGTGEWPTALGAFGRKAGWETEIATPWTSDDLWIRQTFEWDGKAFERATLAIHYDNATEVLVNGKEIWRSERGAWNDAYSAIEVTEPLRRALRPGANRIAVHVHQDSGGQIIDLALLLGRKG